MSFLSPKDTFEMLEYQQTLKQRVDATKESPSSTKCLSALMSLSEELRTYSHQNRAIAEKLRQKSAARREAAGWTINI